MLFSTKDIDNTEAQEQRAFFDDGDANTYSLQSMSDIKQHIGKLEQNRHVYFWSRGQWSMHELLEYLLNQTGPADVWMSTWTVTEDPVRKLFILKKQGLIKSLNCILDYRIQGRKPGPFQLLEKTADRIALTQCHAKAMAIINEEWEVSVIGSANFSKNPRLEAGVICTVPQITQFHKTIMQNEMDR